MLTVSSDTAGISARKMIANPTLLADILEWDVRNWSKALAFWQAHSHLDLSRCRALEIGSRGGGLSLWLALQGAQVVCSDVVDPDPAAIAKHVRYGVGQRISYQRINAVDIPYVGEFDLVVFKSVLGAVVRQNTDAAQHRAVAEMHKALRPGGELFFAENLVGSPVHRLLRQRLVRWGRTWRYITMPEAVDLMSPFAHLDIDSTGVTGALGRTERQRAVLGALDAGLFNRIAPTSWRYIAMGVARK